MAYRIYVENFGKIQSADVLVKPLTLLVGDNNSGKSYLMALIWMLKSGKMNNIIADSLEKTLPGTDLGNKLNQIYYALGGYGEYGYEGKMEIQSQEVEVLLNQALDADKNHLVKALFNSDQVDIGKLRIEFSEDCTLSIESIYEFSKTYKMIFKKKDSNGSILSTVTFWVDLDYDPLRGLYELLKSIIEIVLEQSSTVYLPTGRTGLMLAKDSINQLGRLQTFDVNRLNGDRNISVSPFPKFIIDFLDNVETRRMSYENSASYDEFITWINANMINGRLEVKENRGTELNYYPKNSSIQLPLRAVSGVVSEIAPLVLTLSNGRAIKNICYEEPEMCLHPQLQYQMSRLLIRLVNEGVGVITTTHSDIIVQHINNMCRLSSTADNEKKAAFISDNLQIDEADLIDESKVAVYQFTDHCDYAEVSEIPVTEHEFKVPTFYKALGTLFNFSEEIFDFVEEQEA